MEKLHFQSGDRRKSHLSKSHDHNQGVLFDTSEIGAERVPYTLLSGHRLEDGTWKSSDDLLRQYVRFTDKLIGKLDGTIDNQPPFDAVIYLDKSGRPVAWLVDALWETLAREQGTEFSEEAVPKKPDTFFLNIDREQWLPTVDPSTTGIYNMDAIPQEAIRSLRAIYQKVDAEEDAPTILDGKRILIVDEVGVSGATLKIAKALLKRAIPNAEFDTAHWMSPEIFEDSGGRRNNDVPVWYKKHDATGRGVADRDMNRSEASVSRKQRLGKWFLSTTFVGADPSSVQLRKELKQLASDVQDKKVLYTPSSDRDIDDIIERIETVNGMTVDEFKQIKARL